jgi:hypothetical protein
MGLNNKGSLLRAFVITMALPFLRLPLTPQGVRLKSGPFLFSCSKIWNYPLFFLPSS